MLLRADELQKAAEEAAAAATGGRSVSSKPNILQVGADESRRATVGISSKVG